MNNTVRTLLLALLGTTAVAAAVACSSNGSAPGNFGDGCSVYAVEAPCTGSLLCECSLTTENGCFCTSSCDVPDDCPNDAGSCIAADNPSQPGEGGGYFCFNFLPDGGPLP
jgi:hypothetical protein